MEINNDFKPELIVALEPFEALAGFRPVARTMELMRALAVPDLEPYIELLKDQSDADGLRALFTTWITAPQPDLDVLVPAVIDGAINYVRSGATEFAPVAKALLEEGFHSPTVYFPLIVDEALMFEPTETESLQTLESLAVSIEKIAALAITDPERLMHAPQTTPVSRVDEARAARQLVSTEDAANR